MLAVLDSNILFSALISRNGAPARVYDAWQEDRFELVTCTEQLEEMRKASRYPKLRAILQPHLVGKMINSMQRARVIALVPRKQRGGSDGRLSAESGGVCERTLSGHRRQAVGIASAATGWRSTHYDGGGVL